MDFKELSKLAGVNAATARSTDVLGDRIEAVRDAVIDGAPVTFAFRARNRLVLSERIILASWVLLGALVLPLLLLRYTPLPALLTVILSPVVAQLLTAFIGRGSARALATTQDGSVIVARLAWNRQRVQGIEKIYRSPAIVIEPSTPGWRTQRLVIDGDVWFHCNRATHFERRPERSHTLV